MKVEIRRGHIKSELYNELDYDLFITLFEKNQPLLPSVVLQPMNEQEAVNHYGLLSELGKKLQPLEADTLLSRNALLPSLDHLLNFFENGQLEQYHLFELAGFLKNDAILCSMEESFPLDPEARLTLDLLLPILKQYTDDSFSAMRANPETQEVRADLIESERKLKEAVKWYEHQIFESSGLKMTYPWPRELALSDEQAKNIGKSNLLTLKKINDVYLVDYNKSHDLSVLQSKKDALNDRYETLMRKQLVQLNSELSPFGGCLKEYYRKRVERTWHYVLLAVKEKNSLCLPEFTSERGCLLENGYIYGLKTRKQEKCIPLDLDLEGGATILYGPNMSGKTTALKTVYFLLTLVQLGLPLPAGKVALHYPTQIAFMLKSPGDVRTNTSTYGEELAFFSQPMEDGAYILSDELFLSTDPTNGVILSEILIRFMAGADMVFFCTTHYPDILDIENIALYRMEDPDPLLLEKNETNLQSLQDFMPYRVLPIADNDREKIRSNFAPLQTALLFDLPREIKETIKKHLTQT